KDDAVGNSPGVRRELAKVIGSLPGWHKRVHQKMTETRRKIVGGSRKACRELEREKKGKEYADLEEKETRRRGKGSPHLPPSSPPTCRLPSTVITVTLSLSHLTRWPSLPSLTSPPPSLLHPRTFPLLLPHLPPALLMLPHLSSLICRHLYCCPISICQSSGNPQSQPPLGAPHTHATASFLSLGCFFLRRPSQFLPTSSSPPAIPAISHYSRCNPTAAALTPAILVAAASSSLTHPRSMAAAYCSQSCCLCFSLS
ncbi:hypothetical protein B296_00032616, partial [Ensete ventricosum]